jgi:hypothetical protein
MACMSECAAFTVGGICMGLAPVFYGLTFWLVQDAVKEGDLDKAGSAVWTWYCMAISLILGIVFLSIGCCCAKGEDEEKNEGGSTQVVVHSQAQGAQGPQGYAQGYMPQGHPQYPGQAPRVSVTPYGAVAPGQMSPMPYYGQSAV